MPPTYEDVFDLETAEQRYERRRELTEAVKYAKEHYLNDEWWTQGTLFLTNGNTHTGDTQPWSENVTQVCYVGGVSRSLHQLGYQPDWNWVDLLDEYTSWYFGDRTDGIICVNDDDDRTVDDMVRFTKVMLDEYTDERGVLRNPFE